MQVVKVVDSEHVNENVVQNSSPTCKHNLFALIQSKKFFSYLIQTLVGIVTGLKVLKSYGKKADEKKVNPFLDHKRILRTSLVYAN